MELAPQGLDSLLITYVLAFVVFLGPGHMLASALLERLRLTREQRLSITIVTGGVLGYAMFWVHLLAPEVARAVSMVLVAATLLGILAHALADWTLMRWVGRRWLGAPMVLAFLAGLLYLALMAAPGSGDFGEVARVLFFETLRPHDNNIPKEFAVALREMKDTLLAADVHGWYFSERPPLQSGVVLMLWPLIGASGLSPAYQAIGTVLQVMTIPAMWMVARLLPLDGPRVRFALLLVIATGFVFYNSVYVWPKLLAAAFFLIAARPFLAAWARGETVSRTDIVVSAAAAACAMLSHGATAFAGLALAALALLFVVPWRVRGADLLLGILVAAAIYAPWQVYISEVSPNGGKLLKSHLAGEHTPTDDNVAETVLRRYGETTWTEWFDGRLVSLERLVRDREIDRAIVEQGAAVIGIEPPGAAEPRDDLDESLLTGDLHSLMTVLRVDQREFLFRALWLLNLGWIVFLFAPSGMLDSRRRDRGETGLFVLWVVSVLVWVALLFEPGSTRTTHASYAIVLIPMLLTACRLAMLSGVWRMAVLWLHATTGLVIWVISLPGAAAYLSPDYGVAWQAVPIGIAIATMAVIGTICVRR